MSDPSADPQGSADARQGSGPAPVVVAPPAEGRIRIRMVLAYDGGRYRGMAENEGVLTVEVWQVGLAREPELVHSLGPMLSGAEREPDHGTDHHA